MRNIRANTHAVAVAVLATLAAATACAQPRLVVGIVVDGLEQEYVDLLRGQFTSGGFNRLIRDGVTIENADFGTPLDATAATALLFTGAEPDANGVGGATVFDRSTLRATPSLTDADAMGNFTSLAFSPRGLMVSTIADEARISGAGVTYAYAVAADPAQAVIMAGHAGNCAIWLNQANGNWATSTYYAEPPALLGRRNRLEPLAQRIDTMQWQPSATAEAYPGLPDHLTRYPFRHAFRAGGPESARMFAASPMANTEITSLATEHLTSLQLGKHPGGADMLGIAYTLRPYPYTRTAENRHELLDAYLRLDRDLGRLLTAIDQAAAPGEAVVFLSGTPRQGRRGRDDERWQLPYGEFSARKAMSLLNVYLIALHGNGDWVQGYHDGQFYLNHKLISDRDLAPGTIRAEAAEFLGRMAGVRDSRSVDAVVAEGGSEARNIVVSTCGDVLVTVQPGWQIVDDFNAPARGNEPAQVAAAGMSTAVAYLLIPGATPGTIEGTVDARAIAPTVARALHIRSPNAATVPALRLK